MNITTRADLGWPPTGARPANPTQGIAVHYDGSNQGLASKPHSACLTYWHGTRAFHRGAARGWLDIGYSYGVCPHGHVLEGRGLGREQAAQPGANTTYYSVTFMSGPAEDPTPEQLQAFAELRTWLMSKHGVGAAIKGHRDFVATSCPGDRLYALVKSGALKKGGTAVAVDPTAKKIWTHEIPVPWGSKDNPEWQAKSILVNTAERVRALGETLKRVEAKIDAQGAVILELSTALANLTPGEQVDVGALVARIEQAIEGITVQLTVSDPAAPAA